MIHICSSVLFISYPKACISIVKELLGDFDMKLRKLKVRIKMYMIS